MTRRIRYALALLAVTFALSSAACADATGPGPQPSYDQNNPWTHK
jgi:hypothetical protein